MFVICDNLDVVQDVATEKANLSRGYTYPGFKLNEDVAVVDMQIGDTFKDGVLTKNQQKRDEQLQRQQNEQKITAKIRQDAIAALIAAGDLPAGYK